MLNGPLQPGVLLGWGELYTFLNHLMTQAGAFEFRKICQGVCRSFPFRSRHNPAARSDRREFICLIGGTHARATESLLVTGHQLTFKLFSLDPSFNLAPAGQSHRVPPAPVASRLAETYVCTSTITLCRSCAMVNPHRGYGVPTQPGFPISAATSDPSREDASMPSRGFRLSGSKPKRDVPGRRPPPTGGLWRLSISDSVRYEALSP